MLRSRVREYDPFLVKSKDKRRKRHQTVDYQGLRKYDQRNEHFSMKAVTINEKGKERLIGYNCIYRYGTHQVKLEYNIITEKWTIVNDTYHSEEEEKQLNTFIAHGNKDSWIDMGFTHDERMQRISELFDGYFSELNQPKKTKRNKKNMSKSSRFFETEYELEDVDNELTELSSTDEYTSTEEFSSSTTTEDDEQQSQEDSNSLEKDVVDNGFHSLITSSRPKLSRLVPPPFAPRRSRQNSGCSTQSSVRYASFVSPPTVPVRRRRVIESIHLRVQRKKKIFEKIVNILNGTKPPTMYQLGLQFLHVYDGKFNYQEGHTFAMSFRKKIWFLTIDKIEFVECQFGEFGPRSLLILNYKNQLTTVQVELNMYNT